MRDLGDLKVQHKELQAWGLPGLAIALRMRPIIVVIFALSVASGQKSPSSLTTCPEHELLVTIYYEATPGAGGASWQINEALSGNIAATGEQFADWERSQAEVCLHPGLLYNMVLFSNTPGGWSNGTYVQMKGGNVSVTRRLGLPVNWPDIGVSYCCLIIPFTVGGPRTPQAANTTGVQIHQAAPPTTGKQRLTSLLTIVKHSSGGRRAFILTWAILAPVVACMSTLALLFYKWRCWGSGKHFQRLRRTSSALVPEKFQQDVGMCNLRFHEPLTGTEWTSPEKKGSGDDETVTTPRRHTTTQALSFKQLQIATDNFSETKVIGEGGFGKVYKAILADGRKAAIKHLAIGSTQGQKEFQAEVDLLSHLRHPNLVELLGHCSSKEHRLLVYELMPGGSVLDHLHGFQTPLDWAARVKIAIDSARGLHVSPNPQCIPTSSTTSSSVLSILLCTLWQVSQFVDNPRKMLALVDPTLRGDFCHHSFHYLASIAAACTQQTVELRPTMKEVVRLLLPLLEPRLVPWRVDRP
eukprot:SM000092S24520  [mRNA]  locus=s92:517511:521294:+ [translate_table: standard]